jgi:aquaporin Z
MISHLLADKPVFDKWAKILSPFIVEFIGTFFLTMSIGFNLIHFINSEGVFEMQAALGIGGTLLASVYAGGHISGAHYNPAVTFAVWLSGRNKISTLDAVIFILVQVVAAFAGGLFQWAILEETFRITPAVFVTGAGAVTVEWFWTFLLAFVVLQVATTKPQAGNSFFGLAIGFTVLSGIVSVGYTSGGAFNPAILLGLNFADAIAHEDAGRLEYTWIYLIGGFLGGGSAGLLFHVTNRAEYTETQGSLFSADATAIADIAATKRDKKNLRAHFAGDEDEYEELQTDYLLGGKNDGTPLKS